MKNAWILASAGLLFGFAVTSSAATLSVASGGVSTTTTPKPSGGPCGTSLITQSTSQAITALNSVSCNASGLHADNAYSRSFNMATFPAGFDLCAVEIGIEQATSGAGGVQPVTLNVYSHTGAAYPGGTTTLVSTQALSVADQAATILSAPITGNIPAGADLVVEVFTPDGQTAGHTFFMGSNAGGESGPSFIEAADCGITTPTATSAIGFPNMQIVLNARGTAAGATTIAYTSTPSLTFTGAVGVASAAQNAVVSATAGNTANLSITSCAFGGANAGDFAFNPAQSFPIAVAAGASVNLPVTFTAGAAGARSATLDCVTNGTSPGPNFSVALNGTAGSPTLTITPGTVAFGNVQVGQSANLSTVLSNTGSADLTITAIAAPAAPFALVTDGCTGQTLVPTGSCTMTYSFAPAAEGFATTTLAVTSNAGAANIVLEGTGANPRQVPSAGKLALLTLLLSVFGFAYVRLRNA
jgi:hypothetical protein